MFESAFEAKINKNWDKIYVLVDVHETFMKPNYEGANGSTEFYALSVDVLKMMSDRSDICLILWTCSSAEHRQGYVDTCKELGINFEYQNENPECGASFKWGGDYTSKMYANVILDDKAGFEHECDWFELYKYFSIDALPNTYKNGDILNLLEDNAE